MSASLESLQLLNRKRTELENARMRALATSREELLARFTHPLALAAHFDDTIVVTPALELISRTWVETIETDDGRATVSLGSQEGKSLTAVWALAWALLQNPRRRVILASFSLELAEKHLGNLRTIIELHLAPYGLRFDSRVNRAGYFELAGAAFGSARAVSTTSTMTGFPCDLLLIDDLASGEATASSPAENRKVTTWWESTAVPRLAPGVPVMAIGTRFHRGDYLSRFIEQGWKRINIPAIADGKAFDSVADVPGARTEDGFLISARGRTPADWLHRKAEVGSRAWSAVYQGMPTPPEGNIFLVEWFDDHRVKRRADVPALVEIAVGVDPADTGTGDEAGIVVAGRAADGHLYLLADYSGMLSQAQWARRACLAWLEQGAAKVVQEKSLGMRSSIPDAWSIMRRQASALDRSRGDVEVALAALHDVGDAAAADRAQLVEVFEHVDDILSRPSSGPRVESVQPKQSKLVRAQSVTGLFETGRCHIVESLPELELELSTWTAVARYSPARVDTVAHLLTRLDVSRAPVTVSSPVRAPRAPARSGGGPASSRLGAMASPAGGAALRAIDGGVPAGWTPRRGPRRWLA